MFYYLALPLLLVVQPMKASTAESTAPSIVLVIGAPGEPQYASNFVRQVELWTDVCRRAEAQSTVIGLGETNVLSDREQLEQALQALTPSAPAPLWLLLVGHGTFDGKQARFNLRGPDLAPADLAKWLEPFAHPLVIVNAFSASAPFLNALSATNRIIITATRSGDELSYSHFGQHFAEALASPQSDLDKDEQVSLLEAFVTAASRVADFYKTEDRLATEHALLDDNGDGRGTPGDWFRGVQAIKKPQGTAVVDGVRAHQIHLVLSPAEQSLPPAIRTRRDALELELARLRDAKSGMDDDEYYGRIEKVLLELARLYASPTGTLGEPVAAETPQDK